MDISKISAEIQQAGYNPFGISGTDDKSIQEFAEQNNLSVQEAESVLKEAEKQAEENDKFLEQQLQFMEDILNSQDEEELAIIDDADFDNFLNQESPEQKMQNIFAQQQFIQHDNSQNLLGQSNNPFFKLK